MKYQYKEVSGKGIRLTITSSRVTIKLNPRLYNKYLAITKCLDIAEKVIPVKQVYRRKFQLNSLKDKTAWADGNKHRLFID